MRKIKKINLVNIIIDCIIGFIVLIVNFLLHFNRNGFSFTCFMLAIIAIVNTIFLCIKEAKILTYDTKRYTLILHVSHAILGILLHYVIRFVKGYYNLKMIFWALLLFSIIIPVVVTSILNKKEENNRKTSNGKPKFIMNK